MKKFIALAIAVVMLAALAVPAFATQTADNSTKITYGVPESYEFSVPATLDFDGEDDVITVTVSKLNKKDASVLTVTAPTELELIAADAEGTPSTFVVFGAAVTFEENVIDTTATKDISVSWKTAAPTISGTYEGTVTFTATLA